MKIGFSTGSLSKGDFHTAISALKENDVKFIEISTLRENELLNFLQIHHELDLSSFEYISFHAPSKLVSLSEKEFIKKLDTICALGYDIVLHPDVIKKFSNWSHYGDRLYIENMDKRKPIGQDHFDLRKIIDKLPYCSFCFDIAHAHQIDRTMKQAELILKYFAYRVKQIHISYVNDDSGHEPLNETCLEDYKKVISMIPDVPFIIESTVQLSEIRSEIEKLEKII